MIRTVAVKLVTIVAESVLEDHLIKDIKQLGARGYTLTEVQGEGAHGIRESGLAEGRNIRIETLVSAETADQIMARLVEHYFQDYAIIAYMQDVSVIRKDKYA